MKQRLLPFAALLALCTTLALGESSSRGETTTAAVVDPTIQYQTFEGWGTSLAWWAKVVGGFAEPARSDYMEKAFDPVKGLGLNVVRYNIGGGENPLYSAPNTSFLGFREAVPGFEPTPGTWDWSADANQRWVLKDAIRRGANQLEAFSNSPPYWMTVSGSVTGAKGGQDNLKPEDDRVFADYLATVVRHFWTDWGVTFRDLEPLNEPDGHWWSLGNHQEGCFVERPHQAAVVKAMGTALASAHLPGVTVAAPDSNTIGDADRTTAFLDGIPPSGLSKINVHSYGGGDRTQLSNWAITRHKGLWLSEYGDGDASGMEMSRRILQDMNGLHPTAWCYWQVVDSAGGWGFLKSRQLNETDAAYTINEKYWVMANYSRFVRPGFRLMAITDPNSLAAYDAKTHALVIVTTNDSDTERTTDVDLTRFTRVGPEVTAYRTSAQEALLKLPSIASSGGRFAATLPPKSVTTFVLRAVYGGPLGIDYRRSYEIVSASTVVNGADALNLAIGDKGIPGVHGRSAGDIGHWGLIGVGDGWYKIVNRASGKVLDVGQASKESGAAVMQYEDNGGMNQLWRIVDAGSGAIRLVNRNSGLALAPKADLSLEQRTIDGAAALNWRLREVK